MEMMVPVAGIMRERSDAAAPVVSRTKSTDLAGMAAQREVVV